MFNMKILEKIPELYDEIENILVDTFNQTITRSYNDMLYVKIVKLHRKKYSFIVESDFVETANGLISLFLFHCLKTESKMIVPGTSNNLLDKIPESGLAKKLKVCEICGSRRSCKTMIYRIVLDPETKSVIIKYPQLFSEIKIPELKRKKFVNIKEETLCKSHWALKSNSIRLTEFGLNNVDCVIRWGAAQQEQHSLPQTLDHYSTHAVEKGFRNYDCEAFNEIYKSGSSFYIINGYEDHVLFDFNVIYKFSKNIVELDLKKDETFSNFI